MVLLLLLLLLVVPLFLRIPSLRCIRSLLYLIFLIFDVFPDVVVYGSIFVARRSQCILLSSSLLLQSNWNLLLNVADTIHAHASNIMMVIIRLHGYSMDHKRKCVRDTGMSNSGDSDHL